MGLSLVKIKKIEGTKIVVTGGDFLDQTPVYDLKPYLKEIESIPHASSGWTDEMEAKRLEVVFKCECPDELRASIVDILSLDPRPRFHEDGYKTYGSRLFNVDVHWEVLESTVYVLKILT